MKPNVLREKLLLAWELILRAIPENADILYSEYSKEELADNTMAASKMVGYDALDSYYSNGIESVIQSHSNDTNNSDPDLINELMSIGVAFYLDYGLEADELQEWVVKNPSVCTAPLLLLTNATAAAFTNEIIQPLCDYFSDRSSKEALSEIDTQARNGISFSKNKVDDSSVNQFRFFDEYIVFSESFSKYSKAEDEFDNIVDSEIDAYEEIWQGTLQKSGAYGKNLFETLSELTIAFKDSIESLEMAFVRNLRKANISPDTIKKFRLFMDKKANTAKEVFLKIAEPMCAAFENLYPQGEQYDHGYINSAIYYDHMRRVISSPGLSDGVKGTIAFTGNQILTDSLVSVADSIADDIKNAMRSASFENRMKTLASSDEFRDAIEGTFDVFTDGIHGEYFRIRNIENYDLIGEEAPEKLYDLISPDGYKIKEELGHEQSVAYIKSCILDAPFDYELYSHSYICYGDEAGDLDSITSYLGIGDDYQDDIKDLEDEGFNRWSGKIANTADDVKEYKDFWGKMTKKYGSLSRFQALYEEWDGIEKELGRLKEAKKIAKDIKTPINTLIINGEDKKLADEARNGNGYAEYMFYIVYESQYSHSDLYDWAQQNKDKDPLAKLYCLSLEREGYSTINLFSVVKTNVYSYSDKITKEFYALAEQGIIAAVTFLAENLLKQDSEKREIALKLIRAAEDKGYPIAFVQHADYLDKEKYGFKNYPVLVKELRELAEIYGYKDGRGIYEY